MKHKLNQIKTELQRWADQIHRRTMGLPTMRRIKIMPQLWLGGQYNLRGFRKLKDLGVTAIINMRTSAYHKDEIEKHIKFLHLPTIDRDAPSLENLQKGVAFIKSELENGGRVYIHCKAGEGRGPSMALAYLISTGLTYEGALAFVRKVRTFVKPTQVQENRLREFESLLKR